MPAIPQITRDRLASSAVGTPQIDTSGQQIAESVSKAALGIGQAAGEYAVERQQQIDTAEANRLFTNYKMNAVNSLEKIKTDYANNPEAAGPVFMQTLQDQLSNTVQSSSNPRVNLMVGRGDPYFDGMMVRQQQQWALAQREGLDKAAVVAQGNKIADQAENIGADPNQSYLLKKNALFPLFSAAGNLSAGAFAAAHPASAAELSARIGPTIMNRAIYGMISTNPAQAVQFTQEPEVQKAFESNPKELDALHSAAVSKLKGLAGEEKWNMIAAPLVDSPGIVHDVASGKIDWAQLDQLPQSPLTMELKKMALETSPKSLGQQQDAIANFYSQAHAIGIGIKKGEQKPEASVAQLMDFQTNLAKAYNGGEISKSTYMKMNQQIASPLIGAVTNAHDPNMFERAKNRMGSWYSQQPEKPEDVVDKYTAGYGVINDYLKKIGKENDYDAKSDAIGKYLDLSRSIKPTDRDIAGRPYTPQSVAQEVMEISAGNMIHHPTFGPIKVSGHTADGMPVFDLSKEQQEKFDHLKALKGR